MIDTFRNNTPDVGQRLFETIEIRQQLVTVSDSRKVDLSIMSIQICRFASQCLEDLHIEQLKNDH